uniref:UBN2 domain-containing protein n=1 Tax=Tanacetum cinerariifolium TaxID=118510 RepID=A0A6L2LH24_TANCI|nr:UBN2 domain-containing protein [Tanacetum cinerariifolium]
MDENGSSDLVLFQNALAEFQTGYGRPFTMEACWRILKNHPAWSEVEEKAYEHEICPYLTKKEYQQLLLDEAAFKKHLEEAKAEKERAIYDKELEEFLKAEQAHDELFRMKFGVKSDCNFNTIITSLKALDESFSSKNYVRKFLRALHPKWRSKIMAIEESKDLSSLDLDELIVNLKVHEVVMKKDSEIYRGKKERIKSIALKAKKESSDDETSTSRSNDEEYAIAIRNFKNFFRRKGKYVRQPREEKKSF